MIKIKKSEIADTRTCDFSKVTKEQLERSTKSHISDVRSGLRLIIRELFMTGIDHDLTKLEHLDQFYDDFKTGFKNTSWWEMHQEVERHHLYNADYIQDDVNLIDVIEMIVDGVMSRSGEYKEQPIPDGLLEKAYKNTIKLMLDNVEVE